MRNDLYLPKAGKRLAVQRYVLMKSQLPVALIFTKPHLSCCRAVKEVCVIRHGQIRVPLPYAAMQGNHGPGPRL